MLANSERQALQTIGGQACFAAIEPAVLQRDGNWIHGAGNRMVRERTTEWKLRVSSRGGGADQVGIESWSGQVDVVHRKMSREKGKHSSGLGIVRKATTRA